MQVTDHSRMLSALLYYAMHLSESICTTFITTITTTIFYTFITLSFIYMSHMQLICGSGHYLPAVGWGSGCSSCKLSSCTATCTLVLFKPQEVQGSLSERPLCQLPWICSDYFGTLPTHRYLPRWPIFNYRKLSHQTINKKKDGLGLPKILTLHWH